MGWKGEEKGFDKKRLQKNRWLYEYICIYGIYYSACYIGIKYKVFFGKGKWYGIFWGNGRGFRGFKGL